MVTRIRRGARLHLYLKEHRDAKGVSAAMMAGRLGIERESVYRLEREWRTRMTPDKQIQYAAALGIEPNALLHPPGGPPSLHAIIAEAPDEVKKMAADIVSRLVASR